MLAHPLTISGPSRADAGKGEKMSGDHNPDCVVTVFHSVPNQCRVGTDESEVTASPAWECDTCRATGHPMSHRCKDDAIQTIVQRLTEERNAYRDMLFTKNKELKATLEMVFRNIEIEVATELKDGFRDIMFDSRFLQRKEHFLKQVKDHIESERPGTE